MKLVVSRYKGVSIFCGIGERSREGEELYREMQSAGVLNNTVMVFGQMVRLEDALAGCDRILTFRLGSPTL